MVTKKTAAVACIKEVDSGTSSEKCATKSCTTKVVINYDVGFGNSLSIRGQGGGLNWNQGAQLKNTKSNEWVWETGSSCTMIEFKVLINDRYFETGPNHSIKCGSCLQYTPKF